MTDKAEYLWALRYIVEHSPMNAGDAANLVAQQAMPNIGKRYDRMLARALGDPAFDPTPEDRARLTALLGADTDTSEPSRLNIRVSEREKAAIEDKATAAGLSVSEYMRQRALQQ